MTVTTERPAAEVGGESASREFRWTADNFDRACDAGVFGPDARLELVHGRIIDRMGQGPLHFWLRVRIGRRLRAVLETQFLIVDECPVRIAFDGVPVADVAVLVGLEGDDNKRSPTSEDVVLLVEIAVSSVEGDLGDKALLYAQAGIGDYWVVLAEEEAILVHREPSPQGYASITRLTGTDTITPLSALGVVLAVRDLLGLRED